MNNIVLVTIENKLDNETKETRYIGEMNKANIFFENEKAETEYVVMSLSFFAHDDDVKYKKSNGEYKVFPKSWIQTVERVSENKVNFLAGTPYYKHEDITYEYR